MQQCSLAVTVAMVLANALNVNKRPFRLENSRVSERMNGMNYEYEIFTKRNML